MENMVNIKINGQDYQVESGITVLEAARRVGIEIPTLCYLKDINEIGACRICVVECKQARGGLIASCVYPVSEGLEVTTNSPKVIASRKMTLQLLLSNHNRKCLSCVRSTNCEFQKLCNEYGIDDEGRFDGEKTDPMLDDTAVHMVRDNSKCVLCRRCSAVCNKLQHVGVIGPNERGFKTFIGTAFEADLGEVSCVSCGQCINVCPTGALHEKDETDKVFAAIQDPDKFVIIQAAPSVRVGLGEAFGMPIGSLVTGKMVTAMKMLGFDKVFDTNFTADLTIWEEATEFLDRFTKKENLPLITSCSPGWIKFCEHYHPNLLNNLSTCKSPQGMFGATAKTYYAEKMGIDPKNIFSVSVMPCTAKKFEAQRDQNAVEGCPDIDVALTVRELARMIQKCGIRFTELPDGEFDAPFGLGSGAGTIFGATGGVMEAALRFAVEKVTGKDLENLDFMDVRGTEGIKEATYEVADGVTVRVAVASGLSNAHKLLTMVESGEKQYDFIEIMCCPGGCVNGGGQPIVPASVRNFQDVRAIRAAALYEDDLHLPQRKSQDNEDCKRVYAEYFGEPGGHKAHEILHTHYHARSKY